MPQDRPSAYITGSGRTPGKRKRKKRGNPQHNRRLGRVLPSLTSVEFDVVDSAAEQLADAMIRKSPRFKREKDRLKKLAKRIAQGRMKF